MQQSCSGIVLGKTQRLDFQSPQAEGSLLHFTLCSSWLVKVTGPAKNKIRIFICKEHKNYLLYTETEEEFYFAQQRVAVTLRKEGSFFFLGKKNLCLVSVTWG